MEKVSSEGEWERSSASSPMMVRNVKHLITTSGPGTCTLGTDRSLVFYSRGKSDTCFVPQPFLHILPMWCGAEHLSKAHMYEDLVLNTATFRGIALEKYHILGALVSSVNQLLGHN